MSKRRLASIQTVPARSALFQASPGRPNQILARTLLNEMIRSGKSRSEMIEFVNCFLDLLRQNAGRGRTRLSVPMVDLGSGLPTRAALHELLLHELDPSQPSQSSCQLVLVELPIEADEELAARVLRHRLRVNDVLAQIGKHRLAMLVYVPENGIAGLLARLRAALEGHPRLKKLPARLTATGLQRGDRPRTLWRRLLQSSGRG